MSDKLRTPKQLIDFCKQESPPPRVRFSNLPPEEKEVLISFVGNATRVAEVLSLPGHTIKGSDIANLCRKDGVDIAIDSSVSVQIDSLNDAEEELDLGYWKKRTKRLETEVKSLRQYYAQFLDMYKSVVPQLDPVVPDYPHDWGTDVDEELIFLFLSDVHIGERVCLEDTAGLSEFNVGIFKERCGTYKAGLDSILNKHLRKVFPLKKCYLCMLGDMVTGEDIFPKQMAQVDRLLHEQVMLGIYYLCDIVRYVCSIFDEVHLYMVPGNHGASKTTTMNVDYLLYHMMALALAKQPNLRINISDSDFMGLYINEELGLLPFLGSEKTWNFLLTHGDQARAWNGIPYYGLDRMHARLSEAMGVLWDKMFVGHHHRSAEAENWEMVGAWPGGTDYSLRKMYTVSRPSQLLRGFHPKQGLTFRYEIFLDEEPRLEIPEDKTKGTYTPTNRFLEVLNRSAELEPTVGSS